MERDIEIENSINLKNKNQELEKKIKELENSKRDFINEKENEEEQKNRMKELTIFKNELIISKENSEKEFLGRISVLEGKLSQSKSKLSQKIKEFDELGKIELIILKNLYYIK